MLSCGQLEGPMGRSLQSPHCPQPAYPCGSSVRLTGQLASEQEGPEECGGVRGTRLRTKA